MRVPLAYPLKALALPSSTAELACMLEVAQEEVGASVGAWSGTAGLADSDQTIRAGVVSQKDASGLAAVLGRAGIAANGGNSRCRDSYLVAAV
jgi:hypothetical protein